jgi:hypothetical protein
VLAPEHNFLWRNHAPSKVRFFAWLLTKARIPSRSSLFRKHILTAAEAVCPVCAGPEETASHIIFECDFVTRFWRSLGFSFPSNANVTMLHTYAAPAGIPAETTSTFTLLCCWQVWKHRNAVAFQAPRPCLPLLIKNCRDDAVLWKARLPRAQLADGDAWLALLDSARP